MSSDLQFVMERNDRGELEMWVCRGSGKGCSRNRYRSSKKHCEDCFRCSDEETLGQVRARLNRGDS
jgi:hypothetical protein